MRFHQVKELVAWAADYHRGLAEQYDQLAAGDVNDRVRMALEYLAEHERKMQTELAEYLKEKSQHRKVLETWFDDPEDFPHAPTLDRLTGSISCDSVQDVLSTALTMHRTLQDLYAHRVERATAEDEREFFAALSNGHDAEVRRIARDMQRLEDY
ncbi:ubiquinone biosynthesis protein UbiJ [Halomonas fontilapidosi]|mgnify:CR=1 FL=1|uniref:Ubiquinone biosynthesis protein UbiJ n=1 Tax=Halomonas fontilapidosi TaxID=616675 RepID=A0A7W5GY01_9GAMM|nr:2-hydroxyacyl-CoA dehydratase [Halomonas fontilapidosi]MBB3182959.1 ubiquinone biosynthesis protein UbiJ [Halomonas fontilapidosi]